MLQIDQVWKDLEALRLQTPLVHNITNFVVMNNTANALLAIGAAPVMAHAVEEVEEMVGIASALVINIGTLSPAWIEAMEKAMKAAAAREIPIVFDPVGAGATTYRTATCRRLLDAAAPTIIRGNASEIMALFDAGVTTRGVDSSADGTDAKTAAEALAKAYDCVVVVSGATDLITDGERHLLVLNGHPLMPRVTGLGCTASALVGAFAAANPDPLLASASAMAVMGVCGELAAELSAGPGTLQLHLLDTFYSLTREQLAERLK
ncbi:MAG: hydroxyethylthiazole kinase [Desulfuromonas sp.]|nr:MAG: hydroxyethylthiazole kinase [Desulfuromonas sp.]